MNCKQLGIVLGLWLIALVCYASASTASAAFPEEWGSRLHSPWSTELTVCHEMGLHPTIRGGRKSSTDSGTEEWDGRIEWNSPIYFSVSWCENCVIQVSQTDSDPALPIRAGPAAPQLG